MGFSGAVAQSGERRVRNAKVGSSILLRSTRSMIMSPLARAAYRLLRLRLTEADPRITYSQLAEQLRELSDEFEHAWHRSPEFFAALRDIGRECRRRGLPPLPALVVRADTRRPGEAYFTGKCTGGRTRGERVAQWRRDLERVKRSSYPPL
jgi:hypothetical protein